MSDIDAVSGKKKDVPQDTATASLGPGGSGCESSGTEERSGSPYPPPPEGPPTK